MPNTLREAPQARPPRRKRIAHRVHLLPGASPGTLTPLPGSSSAAVSVLSLGGGRKCAVTVLDDLDKLPDAAETGANWVRVTGLGNIEPLLAIAERYGIRRLALEDTLAAGWRTKLEAQGEYAFFVLQGPPDWQGARKGDHLTLFCKHGLIITFEETPTRTIDALWDRLKKEPLPSRVTHLAELLSYMVLDIIVDNFFPHLDKADEALAELEEKISGHVPRQAELTALHQVKRDLITLRRLLWPFRELRHDLLKLHTPDSLKELKPYFNDLDDHVVQAGELLETYDEVAKSLDNITQTVISNRTNDIIRILTIISTVFMPLSFIAGVYGMNFNTNSPWNMPELSFAYGYPLVLLVMAGIVGVMLWFFRKRGWF